MESITTCVRMRIPKGRLSVPSLFCTASNFDNATLGVHQLESTPSLDLWSQGMDTVIEAQRKLLEE